MWFLEWLYEVFAGEYLFLGVLILSALALSVAAVIAYAVKGESVYVAVAAMIGGGVGIAVACGGVGSDAKWVGLSALLLYSGAVYLLLFCLLSVRRAILARRKRREAIQRRLQYTLPERENTYIRTRLHTALHCEDEEFNADMGASKDMQVKLKYAKELLCKVKEAPLSVAERLQVEEMGKAFALYDGKEGWTAMEQRGVNDLCGALVKLSAKYAV